MNLRLAPPRLGDRVRITAIMSDFGRHMEGKTGVLESINRRNRTHPYVILLDDTTVEYPLARLEFEIIERRDH